MTQITKIAHNTIIQVAGKALTISLALIGFGLMTRYLGQTGFGFFSTVYAFLAIFGILVDLGLQMTTTKLISDPAENESQILSNALTIRLVASVIFLSLAPLVALLFPYHPMIKLGIAFATVGFVFASLTSTLTSYFQKHLIIYQVVVAESIAKIIFIAVVVAAIRADLGLTGIITAVIFDSVLTAVILFWFALQKVLLRPRFEFEVWKKILGKTWPIALTITLNLIYFKGDIFIMSLIKSQAEVGLYGAPYRVLEVLINVAYLFLGLVLPILAAAVVIKKFDQLKKAIQATFDFLIILTIPMIVGGFFLGEEIMILMAGPEFVISGEIIKILLLATGLVFIAGLFGYVVVALDKQKEMIKFYAINAVVSVAGYWYLISKYSYWGAAWMTVVTELFTLITALYVMKKSINFIPNTKLLGKAIAASLVMAIPLFVFPYLNFTLVIFIGVTVYFSALYLFKGFDRRAIAEIVNYKKNEAPRA